MTRMTRMTSALLLLGAVEHAGALVVARNNAGRMPLRSQPRMSASVQTFEESQWALYTAQSGRWEGVWSTIDHMGSMKDESEGVWSVQLVPGEKAEHQLEIPGGRTVTVGKYEKGSLGRQVLAGHGMVTGPSLLKSGLMSTELTVRYGAARIRVTLQHAPAMPNEKSDQEGPALLVYRCVVARERCDHTGTPTRANEEQRWSKGQAAADGVKFWRGVTPFEWRKTWGGESSTVTTRTGEFRDWKIDELEENDRWHESRAGEADFTLSLPGGVLVQAPSVILPGKPVPLRLSWLPRDDVLLRSEATIVALEQQEGEENQGAFLPPRLLMYRNDAFTSGYVLPRYDLKYPVAE